MAQTISKVAKWSGRFLYLQQNKPFMHLAKWTIVCECVVKYPNAKDIWAS